MTGLVNSAASHPQLGRDFGHRRSTRSGVSDSEALFSSWSIGSGFRKHFRIGDERVERFAIECLEEKNEVGFFLRSQI